MRFWGEAAEKDVGPILAIAKTVMEKMQKKFPLPPSWGMGDFLNVKTEAKVGPSWGSMEGV